MLTEMTIMTKASRGLPSKFDHVVEAIKEPMNLSTSSFDELMAFLQSPEARVYKIDEKTE